jgi:hypothetical protein
VYVHRVLRKISGPTRDEVTDEQRRLHNEELHDLYSSSNAIRMIKSRSGLFSSHRGEERCTQGFGGEMRGKETTWKTHA